MNQTDSPVLWLGAIGRVQTLSHQCRFEYGLGSPWPTNQPKSGRRSRPDGAPCNFLTSYTTHPYLKVRYQITLTCLRRSSKTLGLLGRRILSPFNVTHVSIGTERAKALSYRYRIKEADYGRSLNPHG